MASTWGTDRSAICGIETWITVPVTEPSIVANVPVPAQNSMVGPSKTACGGSTPTRVARSSMVSMSRGAVSRSRVTATSSLGSSRRAPTPVAARYVRAREPTQQEQRRGRRKRLAEDQPFDCEQERHREPRVQQDDERDEDDADREAALEQREGQSFAPARDPSGDRDEHDDQRAGDKGGCDERPPDVDEPGLIRIRGRPAFHDHLEHQQ